MKETKTTSEPVKLFGGDVWIWTDDDSSIHLKVVSPYNDPVELSAEEAKELAAQLLRLAARLE